MVIVLAYGAVGRGDIVYILSETQMETTYPVASDDASTSGTVCGFKTRCVSVKLNRISILVFVPKPGLQWQEN